jgi:transposase
LTTKIHAIVDALGNPLAIRLTGGQAHDITQAEALLAEVSRRPSSPTRVTTPTASSKP